MTLFLRDPPNNPGERGREAFVPEGTGRMGRRPGDGQPSSSGGLFQKRCGMLRQFGIEVRAVFCTLCASMTNPIQEKPSSGSKMRVLFQRLFSTLVLLGLLAGALAWNREAGYYGLICIFCILTAWEWRHMLLRSGKAGQARLSFLFGAAYPVLLSIVCFFNKYRLAAPSEWRMMPDPLLVVAAAPVVLLVAAFMMEMKRPIVGSRALRSVATTLLAFLYPGWLFAFAIPALQLAYMEAGSVSSRIIMIVLWVILVTKMSDIFAYLSGMLLGGRFFTRKLIPHISPKKTWEGIIGSWLLTNAAGIGLVFPLFGVASLGLGEALMLALCITLIFILSVYGDLAGSLVKRSLAVKDSGSLLPGIGGLFDLIDSPSFTVPFLCLLLMTMVY